MSAYLRFEEEEPLPGRKTKVVWVQSIRHGYEPLGQIRWFGRWRQYVFMPERGTVFSPDCLDTINGVVRDLMAQRKRVSA